MQDVETSVLALLLVEVAVGPTGKYALIPYCLHWEL